MRYRFFISLPVLFILNASCSPQKVIYFPVIYKGWVEEPITDSSHATSFFLEDGRIRLSRVSEGDYQATWNLEILNAKNVVFQLKAQEAQIIISPELGVDLKLIPLYVDYPEIANSSDFEFVLSEPSEFFMLYDRPDEIEPKFYIEGIVKLGIKARNRRIKQLIYR